LSKLAQRTLSVDDWIATTRDAASTGRIVLIGRLGGKGDHKPIPATYWLSATLDRNTVIRKQPVRTAPTASNQATIPMYTDLFIAESDIEQLWPPSSEKVLLSGWEKLWEIKDKGVQIRFFPDSKNRKDDGLLLIIFGYKALLDQEEVSQRLAHDTLIPPSTRPQTRR
jgi:hypothetical protein